MAERHNKSSDELERELATGHAQSESHHQELRRIHEGLKQQNHTFMAQLAMSRHKPNREE
jgi:hypothetical protein